LKNKQFKIYFYFSRDRLKFCCAQIYFRKYIFLALEHFLFNDTSILKASLFIITIF
jgi:hypothetical protein